MKSLLFEPMGRKAQGTALAVLSIVLTSSSTVVFAQMCPNSGPGSNMYNNECLRREDEIRRNEEAAKRQSDGGQSSGSAPGGSQYNAQTQADLKAARARLLKMAPLPEARNPLLGRWRIESAGRSRKRGDMAQLMGMLNNPGGAMCETLFGAGSVTEFKPKTWSSIDSYGNDSLGPIHYRGEGRVVWAVPESKMFNFFGFEFASPDRMTLVGVEGCTMVRAGAAAASTTTAPPGNARAAVASPSAPPAAGGLPQVAQVAPSPPPTPSRPSPEVCRNTLLDKLGTVGVAQVRVIAKVRFTEAAIEGKVPNSDNLRLDLRGSACDDPRIQAMLYDFDAKGVLQAITYVWERPSGPAPAPIFSERVATLSRFHSLPSPQAPGRLQGDTALGRLTLQDMPERNLLLEAYAARK